MRGLLALVLALSAVSVGAAHAQACLSYSDGLGNTTVSCPDGRSGYLHTDPTGAVSGMIGAQPYQGTASSLAPPSGPTAGTPSAAYIAPPIPPSIAPPTPSLPATAGLPDAATPVPGLTPLQEEYLRQRAADAAKRAAEARRPPTPSPSPRGGGE